MAIAEPMVPQHMRALTSANAVRLDRADWKRGVGRGVDQALAMERVCAAIMEPPVCLASMPVGDLLMALHRWGRTRMRRTLARVPLQENKPLRALTARQRRRFVLVLTHPVGAGAADDAMERILAARRAA